MHYRAGIERIRVVGLERVIHLLIGPQKRHGRAVWSHYAQIVQQEAPPYQIVVLGDDLQSVDQRPVEAPLWLVPNAVPSAVLNKGMQRQSHLLPRIVPARYTLVYSPTHTPR